MEGPMPHRPLQGVSEIQQRQRIHAHALSFSEQIHYLVKRAESINVNSDTDTELVFSDASTKTITKTVISKETKWVK